ncbi:alpha/beta hydrolase [Microbacterium sp. SS28]|uniref:alpha/beta hydrolase n=1 Tax=Microbacterium sp. SS28 TaxID=2919948 RepID=UPI001FAB1B7D|nr:alpha/beta hydrolase [Microbacterium sp. SS28]
MIHRFSALTAGLAVAVLAVTGCASGAPADSGESTPVPSATAGATQTEVYRTVDGTELTAEICEPEEASAPAPAIVLLHGGGFSEGTRSSMLELCAESAAQGIVGVTIDYRLLPENSYPAQVDDATAAVAWLKEPDVAEKYGVDPDRIGMIGSSAGAIITATLATRDDSGLSAAAALSPVSDMRPSGLELGTPTAAAVGTILAYLGCTDIEDCAVGAEASPLPAVTPGDVPLFLAAGTNELVPVGQVEALHDALVAAGVPTEMVLPAGQRHGLALLTDEVRAKMFAFMVERL